MTAELRLTLHDGARRPFRDDARTLLTVRRQFEHKAIYADWQRGNAIRASVPVPNDGTGYAVLASTTGHEDAGIVPLKVVEGETRPLHFMMIPRDATYRFDHAIWGRLPQAIQRILMGLDDNKETAKRRHGLLLQHDPDSAACFLNIVAAMSLFPLPHHGLGATTAFDYLEHIEFSTMQRDRFYAFAHEELETELERSADNSGVNKELLPGIFHRGAKSSYKQTTFSEANLQITFHEQTRSSPDGRSLVRVEIDMDYYADSLSHFLLEVVPNTVGGDQKKTDPRQIYAMRWMASRAKRENPAFEPLYTLG